MQATASQTIGPYWHLIENPDWADLTRFGAPGERIALLGTITDGDGMPVSDACVEIWQASPPADGTWDGFGRTATDAQGRYRFITLKPGPIPAASGTNQMQAPHIAITIFARGLLRGLNTRAYFDGEALNARDPLLETLPPRRRATLLAAPLGAQEGMPAWQLDIRLQGGEETVFLDI
jgi:protocatechuate 3,4-dioxygenase, alpha subunit